MLLFVGGIVTLAVYVPLGNPESVALCRKAGFTYVSCSPYRVPLARLAAAHLALTDPINEN